MRFEDAIKMEKFENPSKRAIANVYYTGYWLGDRLNEYLKPFGISEQQFNVLRVLRDNKNSGSNLCDIQERMMHKMSNATRLVEKLRLKGLVTRETCEDNRRRVDIKLTEKGLKLALVVESKVDEFSCGFKNKLTEEEYTQLADLLDKMRE